MQCQGMQCNQAMRIWYSVPIQIQPSGGVKSQIESSLYLLFLNVTVTKFILSRSFTAPARGHSVYHPHSCQGHREHHIAASPCTVHTFFLYMVKVITRLWYLKCYL